MPHHGGLENPTTRARDMERRAMQRAVGSGRVEEDVNPPNVHKKFVDFIAKTRLLKQYRGVSWV